MKKRPSLLKKLHWSLLHNGPRRVVTKQTKNGKISFDSKDSTVGKHVFFQGEYDIDKVITVTNWLIDNGYLNATNPGVTLNVGANIGLMATALNLHSVCKKVIAFEPEPSNFELLTKNVKQNNMNGDIDCINMALSSEDGTIEMELSNDNHGDHRIRRTNNEGAFGENNWKTVQVGMNRLDTFMHSNKKDIKLGLIFMDIQGHEYDFFLGAKDIILDTKIPTLTEFWPYGLNRANVTEDKYCNLVSSIYTHYCDTQDMIIKEISDISSLFNKYNDPDTGTDIILVNKNWSTAQQN